ncbi:hypothetical protein T08_1801 [Trichinella sp. T8]|nr:hypothetical protein T08_1801 [Trichinella sp. T8]
MEFYLSCLHHFVLNVASQKSLVPLATLVHMDIKAFPRRPGVPLLITNSIFLLLWTPCLVMFTSVCSRCGTTNILGYVKRAHFIHDSITLTSSEFMFFSDGSLSRCTSQHFVLDSNGLRHHQNFCLVAADATLKLPELFSTFFRSGYRA